MLAKISITFFLALSAGPAYASSFCLSPSEVANKVDDCTNNEYVSEAAVFCLNKIQSEIEKAQIAVKESGEQIFSQAKDNQADLQKSAQKDYQFSKATLENLISQANTAQEEVIAYAQLLEPPEDYDQPDITGLEPEVFLSRTPCFAENKKVIYDVAEDIDFILSDLNLARDKGEALEDATSNNQSNLNSASTMRVESKGKKGSAKAQPRLKKNASGISDSSLPKK